MTQGRSTTQTQAQDILSRIAIGVAAPVIEAALALGPFVVQSDSFETPMPASGDHDGASNTSVSESLNVSTTPRARCDLSTTEITPGESVTLDASASENATAYRYDNHGTDDFGPWVDSATRTFTYEEPGTYEPRVQVRSPDDFTDTAICGTLTVVEEENQPPTVEFSYSPSEPEAGEGVSFGAEARDEDGKVVGYEWHINGEIVAEGPAFEYVFEEPGDHRVVLTVTDDGGSTTTAERTVTYQWDLDDDDDFEKQGEVIQYEFTDPGEQTVTLRAVGPDDQTKTSRKTISISEASAQSDNEKKDGPTFWFILVNPEPNETVILIAESTVSTAEIDTYRWDLDVDGETDARGEVVTWNFQKARGFSVNLVIEWSNGTTTTIRDTITVGNATTSKSHTGTTGEEGTTDQKMMTESVETSTITETECAAGPGFGVGLAVGVLVAVAIVLARRERR